MGSGSEDLDIHAATSHGRIEKTYQQVIIRNTRLWSNTPQMIPVRSKWEHSIITCSLLVNATDKDNVVLHGLSEAGALQSGLVDTLEEHVREVDIVLFVGDAINEETQQFLSGLVQKVAILDGDIIYHLPWILGNVSWSTADCDQIWSQDRSIPSAKY